MLNTREFAITTVTYDSEHSYPELHPDTDYGDDIPVKVEVEQQWDCSEKAVTVVIGGSRFLLSDLEEVIKQAKDFYNKF